MQISSRFTIAIHIFACIETYKGEYKLTSEFLAASVNVNPVVIRRLLQQLKGAGLITVARGSGGAALARPSEEITFLDVYHAVECVEKGELFHFHENPNPKCAVGRNIHNVLDEKLVRIQRAMEEEMEQITIADVIKDTKGYIEKEGLS
ncbi:MAG TPA: Rrf2 family transcriptional regulator [Candidatus Blautia pullicola]|jgi:Rrf2 family protein|uniref:Rrf2 family transcriptional regulator n=1 Tax=Candidatus Blautia pullicola TaxID=2838498 RepID=A0A9D2JTQ8_9FIRM|nr:Rrf2 family transcriptional regulator [Candidatus Blautia pullicola]